VTTLHVLGSGSKGNCFAIASDGATLLIDAGFSAREVERRAALAGVALDSVVGIALTHEHGDHVCGAARLARRLRVPVLTAPGTWESICASMEGAVHIALGCTTAVSLGPFVIHACPTSHDAAEPVALAVHCVGGERIGIAYDLGRPTAAVRYLLRNLTAVVLEANHDEMLLKTCGYPPSVQQRIAGSSGHLSNRVAAELLAEVHHPGLGLVVLAHLSERSNHALEARGTVEAALRKKGFRGELHVALQHEPLPPLAVGVPAGTQFALGI
jgi:phosphoribosyl 1,2-cyclic phosphodiesterase